MAHNELGKDLTFTDEVKVSQNDSVSDQARWDEAAEKKLLWKMDLLILPVLFLFYMLSFLDRVNLGNAAIEGLTEDLDLGVDNRYNVALLIFYSFYVPLEVPSNMLLKYCRPSLYLPGLMFAWGIINMCMGFVQSYQALYGLRILLGIFEAGLVPGVVYVTSMYYRRHEYQKRLSIMFVATSVGGAVGGLLAYAIANLAGKHGYAGWRWIFIIEGAITAFVAALAPLVLVDWPETCRFFNQEERDMIHARLVDDGGEFRMDTLNKFTMKLTFLDYKVYLASLAYMGLSTSGLAMSFFLPTVLNEYGWKASEAQVHTIPIYAFCLVLTLVMSWASDKLKHRYGFIMSCCLLSTIGYAMLLNVEHLSRNAKYCACFFIAGGGLCAGPLCIVFLSNNLAGHVKRSFGSAVQVSFGGIAGIIGSTMFLAKEKPIYHTGASVGLAMVWVAGAASTLMVICMKVENRKRERGERDERLSWSEDKVNNMGDYHPGFRFTL